MPRFMYVRVHRENQRDAMRNRQLRVWRLEVVIEHILEAVFHQLLCGVCV